MASQAPAPSASDWAQGGIAAVLDAGAALLRLADQAQLPTHVQRLFRAEPVNPTEGRPALHMALRGSDARSPEWGQDISAQVATELARFLDFAQQAYCGKWQGYMGVAVTDVVNIGIGGSIPFIADLKEVFPAAQILVTGVEDPDSRAHSPNESLHIETLRRAILAESLVLLEANDILNP